MTSQTEHTPLPWEVVEATENHGPYITTAFGTTVCDLYAMTDPHSNGAILRGETKARSISHTDADLNAPLIVRAVNCHDDLLAACKNALQEMNARIDFAAENNEPAPIFIGIADLHAAIAKAEGRS